ncbi:MAG: CoA transferase [Acidobacteria bacterium]|nr:CoA transferase [Acidobacteriota bacterium]
MSPLDGIRVVDLSRVVSGPYCTMTLADMGADVIKIEEPGRGDESRAFGPPFLGGESPYFLSINRNKRSCTVNLKCDDGRAILGRLVAGADVLVQNFRPGAVERLGLDYDSLAPRHPRLVYCSISGFGDSGPDAARPGYDLIVQGESGLMDLTGEPDGPPTRVGTSIADLTSGMMAAQGILLALFARQTTGRGQHVRVAMLDAVVSLLTYNTGNYFATGEAPTRRGNDHPSVAPYQTLRAADGWINLGIANDALWRRYCDALERPDLRDDPRFATAPERVRHRTELVPVIEALTAERTVEDWIRLLGAAGVPCGRIRNVAEVCTNPQLTRRGKVVERPHPTAGVVKTIGQPIELGDTPARIRTAPPLLGEQTDDVLREAGYTADEIRAFRGRGAV